MKGTAGSSPRRGDAGRSHPATEDCAKQERAEKPPWLPLFLGFSACVAGSQLAALAGALLNRGIDTKARGREIPVTDQCVWAGNWDLRESIPEQAGMDFHPRGKARPLPCSTSLREMLGKLAQAGAGDQKFRTRLRLGAGGRGTAAEAGLPAQMAAAWLLPQADGVPGKYCARVSPRAGSRSERGAGCFGRRCWGRGWMRLPRAGLPRTSGAFAAALGNGAVVN